MKITNVRIEQYGGKIALVADCKIRPVGMNRVYFAFDKKYKDVIPVDASPFAAALLIPSMKMGQDLIIEGSISRELFLGMLCVVNTMAGWNVGLKRIDIKAAGLTEDIETGAETGSFFSGGVDSFYTYEKHKDEKLNLIFVRGFDIPLHDKTLWEITRENIEKIAREENVNLIEVESNIREIINPVVLWDYSHGGCLAAIGLCLRGAFKKIYVPSSYTKEQQFPWGSHPDIDKLWSTSRTEFVHDGTEASRVKKVKEISQFPVVLKYLRVCYSNIDSSYNCGTCDKCLRTMINLYAAGKLNESKTFPHFLPIDKIASLQIDGEHGAVFQRENLEAVRGMNPALERALEKTLENVRAITLPMLSRIKVGVFNFDAMYCMGITHRMFSGLRSEIKEAQRPLSEGIK